MVLFPPSYQIAKESLQYLQNKMFRQRGFVWCVFFASRPTKMVMKIRNPKDIISCLCGCLFEDLQCRLKYNIAVLLFEIQNSLS
jgi:hypothetical protein